ncbi:MAG: universal stress protein [Acidobacteria bacterium]|nr:universal stress protein [Acidobacteriota bacterium]
MSEKSQEQITRKFINKILCPTNLNPSSDEALRYGVALARAYNAKLYLCYVSEEEQKLTPEQVQQVFVESIAPYINMQERPEINWEGMVSSGEASEVIPQVAREIAADLIIMRSRRRPYAAMLLGSTAEAVCHTAKCPVLVTHRKEKEWVDLEGEIKLNKVLVAYDFSEYSDLALNYGLSLAQEFQTELHLMNVSPNSLAEDSKDSFDRNKALEHLQKQIPNEVHLWAKIIPIVATGKPYNQILSYAQENNIDLICIGAHGKENDTWALFGSNADRVLRQASCPVLIVHLAK